MEQPVFHVVLHGRKVGPYDRRTIVGMRIKKTLDSEHVLIDNGGNQLTVADLIGSPRPGEFNPNRSVGVSVVHATYPASLVQVDGKALGIPAYQGELELRVQSDVLRLAGRFRKGFGWKESRVKVPMRDIVHQRVRGSQVEIWVRAGGGLHRVVLELFVAPVAQELAGWLADATPWPESQAVPAAPVGPFAHHHVMWVSVGAIAAVVCVVLAVLFLRRLY